MTTAVVEYASAVPFPHTVIDRHWPDRLLDTTAAEFPPSDDNRWRRYDNDQERKLEGGPLCWGPAARELVDDLADSQWISRLEQLTGIDRLTIGLDGAGMHCILPGGLLQPHIDFNRGDNGLYRRVNVLIYLNRDWDHEDGGDLELWDDDGPVVIIPPTFNTTVVFSCSERSWHGHPRPVRRERRSFAAYYFSPEPPSGDCGAHSTVWRPS